jgi:hypothetical protein|tara:strand:+ start:17686 stop:18675 length:990 start_codon:yes stop_codon:yes gene_type:complete
MTRQNLDLGTYANDGTGDTLRSAGAKTNANFIELFQKLGGDSNGLNGTIAVAAGGLTFEGTTADDFETSLNVVDPTADRTAQLPDADGTVVLDVATQTLTNKTLMSSVLSTPKINDTSSTHTYSIIPGELNANVNINLPILGADDEFIFSNVTQSMSNKQITVSTITSPRIVSGLNDENGAIAVTLTAISSAVNNIEVTNAAVGSSPVISAEGTDANINLKLSGKGNGSTEISKAAFTVNQQTANGAVSSTSSYISCNKGSTLALTMADGTTVGEYKIFTNKGAGNATVTPDNFAQGISFTLPQYTGCQVVWDGTNWFLIGNQDNVTIL